MVQAQVIYLCFFVCMCPNLTQYLARRNNGAGLIYVKEWGEMPRSLTDKQKLFIDHYVTCWNATEAARQAGYQGNYQTLRRVGADNLTKPHIRAVIDEKMQTYAMTAEEALARLAEQARGIDSGSLAEIMETSTTASALRAAQNLGVGHLIKKVKRTTTIKKGVETEYFEIDLIDTQAALFKVLHHLGQMKDYIVHLDWRTEAIQDIQNGKIKFKALVEALDDSDLAKQLFREAGVPIQNS